MVVPISFYVILLQGWDRLVQRRFRLSTILTAAQKFVEMSGVLCLCKNCKKKFNKAYTAN